MGVHGLWKLIESSGKPVPLETLENKVLAVDVSIWLHQAVKGFQDHKGAPVPNAHLLGIYHRVCKLLYFKIKPIFVFDGGVPALKRQTIAKRNQYKSKNLSEADRLQRQLLSTLLKHSAISKVLSEKTKASIPLPKKSARYDNLYAPPLGEFDSTLSSSDDDLEEEIIESSTTTDSSPTKQWDLHTIDTTSHYFKSLPLEVKHEILTELKETRKQNSWGKLHQLPKQSDDFSSYQMNRLLKRQEVQSALDNVSKEMGGMSLSLAELESLLNDQGIKTTNDPNFGKRIASDDNTRYLYIKDIQEEIKKAEEADRGKKNTELNVEEEEEELKKAIQLSLEDAPSTSKSEKTELKKKTKADMEEEEELRKAIQLSLGEDTLSSNKPKSKVSFLETFNDGDFQSESDEDYDFEERPKFKKPEEKKMSSAQSYMLEYSGLTPAEIEKIIRGNNVPVNKKPSFKNPKLNSLNSKSIGELQKSENQEIIIQLEAEVEDKAKETSKKPEQSIKNSEETLNITTKQIVTDKSTVEVISDSEDSDDADLCDVESPKPLEILIDPNKIEDDLFQDIFHSKTADDVDAHSNTTIKESSLVEQNMPDANKPLEIVIDPNKEDDGEDLFKDIFDEISISSQNKPFGDSKQQSTEENQEESLEMDTSSESFTNSQKIEEIKDHNVEADETKTDSDKGLIKSEENIESSNNSEVNNDVVAPVMPKLTIQEMQDLKDNLQQEKIDILREKSNKERLANNITDQMYQEAQELLELFGVPYVVAPMEAEAQCAFLDEIELTNGTITDDSDIWLFGGRTVYKNFFNQSKYVMEFKSENIEHHFKLSRQQMILLALLVGSDYTTGLQGVGPVTALEILASFPPVRSHEFTLSNSQLLSGLREFKSWYTKGKTGGPGRSSLKNKLKNVTFIDYFPNPQVVQAYLDPKVETSKDPFSWSKPDIAALTVFAKEKFGWTMKKTEEVLNPVIKKLEENQTQKSIKEYFKTKFKIDAIDIEGKVSKRVKSAIGRIGKSPDELIAEEMAELEKAKRKTVGKNSSNKSEKSKSTRNKKTKKVDETINKSESTDELSENMSTKSNDKLEEKVKIDSDKNVRHEETKTKRRKKKDVSEEQKEIKPGTSNTSKTKTSRKKKESNKDKEFEAASKSLEEMEELKDYENLALELKTRRKRKNELMKIKTEESTKKKLKVAPPVIAPLEDIPEELEEDEEVKFLTAVSSNSAVRVEEIKTDVLKHLEEKPKAKKAVPIKSLHTKDVIHQRLRDKSNLLRNKIKAIEVFRKSKKGPGYVPKRKKSVAAPKEDAELSEDSD